MYTKVDSMTITITPDGFLAHDDIPEVGKTYLLEPAENGTEAQNRFFHALVSHFFYSGLHSYSTKDFSEFRDCIKRDCGAGFEHYVYASFDGVAKAKTLDEVPEEYRNDTYCFGVLKSWAKYTKKERRVTCNNLISLMLQAGVNDDKFTEILKGAEKVWI